MKFNYKTKNAINNNEYLTPFLEKSCNNGLKVNAALERAWQNRNFEIDKYWSRATYFWTFIAASLTGYVLVTNAANDKVPKFQEFPFIIASFGVVFSFAWYLVNVGSKKWQENWEKHIDILEDFVTGPIYKTVIESKGYSVSKINLIVSKFVCFVWIILWFKSLCPWETNLNNWEFSYLKFLIAALTLYFVIDMMGKHDANSQKKKSWFSFRRRVIVEQN